MPSSESRRGMAGVWLRLVAFCLPLLLGWAVLEVGMKRVENSHSFKRERLRAIAGEVDTLILGASEAYYGITPHEMRGTAFNLANSSQSLYFDERLVEKLLPQLPRLRRVIVTYSYFSLFFELHDHTESWRQYQYQQEWGIPPQLPRDRLDLRTWSRVALYEPHIALEALSTRFRKSLAQGIDDRGWYRVPEQDRWPLERADAEARLAVHHGFMHDEYVADNTAVLERLFSLLKSRGVEIVVVTMPVWPTYEAGMRADAWERARSTIEGLCRTYGARYLNFHHEPRLSASDFSDSDHLGAQGAVHFTRLLDAALGSPLPSAGGDGLTEGP